MKILNIVLMTLVLTFASCAAMNKKSCKSSCATKQCRMDKKKDCNKKEKNCKSGQCKTQAKKCDGKKKKNCSSKGQCNKKKA